MKKLNWNIIESNVAEAREELQNLEEKIKRIKKPNLIDLQVSLQHAYHHLNFAWNIKNKTTMEYRNLTKTNFVKWSKYPKSIERL